MKYLASVACLKIAKIAKNYKQNWLSVGSYCNNKKGALFMAHSVK